MISIVEMVEKFQDEVDRLCATCEELDKARKAAEESGDTAKSRELSNERTRILKRACDIHNAAGIIIEYLKKGSL